MRTRGHRDHQGRSKQRGGGRRRARTIVLLVAVMAIGTAGAAIGSSYLRDGVSWPSAGAGHVPDAVDNVDDHPAGDDAASASEAERLAAEAAEREAAERRAAEEQAERERIADEERAAEDAEVRAAAERVAEEEAAAAAAAERAREVRAAVTAAQQRLKDLGYLVGAVDGEQGQQTTAALMAFQAVNGIQVDGVLGPQTTETLATPRADPQLVGGAATRIEVDLDRQVLHLIEGGARVVTMKVSSGNGATYARGDGSPGRAVTPVGTFTIERRIAGVRESSAGLGTLFDPMYFLRGFAIHGSNSVPAGPASHGCVRVSRADAVWLFHRVPDGTAVVLHGGQHTFVG